MLMSVLSANSTTVLEYFLTSSPELQRAKLFIWSFVLPPICLVGIVTNVLNVIVFFSLRKSKNKLYLYFLVHSVCDLLYLLICLVYFAFKTSLSERYNSFYWVVIYERFSYLSLTTMIATLLVLVELMISLKRLFLVLNFNLTFKLKFRTVLLVCSLLAVFVHLPMPVALYVKETRPGPNASTRFEVAYDRMMRSAFYRTTFAIPMMFRGLVAPLLLLLMTIVLYRKLGRQLHRKRQMVVLPLNARRLTDSLANTSSPGHDFPAQPGSEVPLLLTPPLNQLQPPQRSEERIQSAKRNLTRMIISVNLLFILSNAATFATTMFIIKIGNKARISELSAILSNLVLFAAHALTIGVYYNFDSIFRRTFHACVLGQRE